MVVRARCAQSDGSALAWAFDQFGSVLTHPCGVGSCLPESDYLLEEIQSATCGSSYAHKVTLVLDGGNINDGTFNQLAYEGGVAACTAAASCCLEVDRVDDDVAGFRWCEPGTVGWWRPARYQSLHLARGLLDHRRRAASQAFGRAVDYCCGCCV